MQRKYLASNNGRVCILKWDCDGVNDDSLYCCTQVAVQRLLLYLSRFVWFSLLLQNVCVVFPCGSKQNVFIYMGVFSTDEVL